MIVRAQPTSGFHLMATRANQLPKLGPTLMVTSWRVPKEGGSLTMIAQSDPTSGFTLTAIRASQQHISGLTLMATLQGSLMKDRAVPTITARSSAYIGFSP